jgi:hypothetical protein
MNSFEEILDIIKQIHVDFRAEVILAEFQKMGLDDEDYIVSPVSLFERRFSKDIKSVGIEENKSGLRYLNFKLNREGIYDTLPQALIHSSLTRKGKSKKNVKDMVDEIKLRRHEENAARKFFSPFENEFYKYRVKLEREERRLLHAYQNNVSYTDKVDFFWNLPKIMNAKEKSTLLFLLPILHRIIGDLNKIEACYKSILGVPVSLKRAAPLSTAVNLQPVEALILGVNFITGQQIIDGSPVIEVSLGPLSDDKIKDFLPGSRGRKVIDTLNNYFMPLEADIVIKTIADRNIEHFVLNKSNAQGRIGITSRL